MDEDLSSGTVRRVGVSKQLGQVRHEVVLTRRYVLPKGECGPYEYGMSNHRKKTIAIFGAGTGLEGKTHGFY